TTPSTSSATSNGFPPGSGPASCCATTKTSKSMTSHTSSTSAPGPSSATSATPSPNSETYSANEEKTMPADHHPQPSSAEQQLRDLLSVHASRAAGNAHSLDAETVITRARRRRSPRQLAVAGATGLVLVTALAITVPALTQLGPDTGGAMDAATLAESDMEQRGHPPEVVDDSDSACFGTLEGTAGDGVDLTVEARTAAGVESGWTIDA